MAKIVFQKRKSGDDSGYLFIRHIRNGKRILFSLNARMSTFDFDTHFNKKHQVFKPTSAIDFRGLNESINHHINLNPFDEVIPTTLLTFWKSQLDVIGNPSTLADYNQNMVKMTKYLTSIDKLDLSFTDIDVLFLKRYKIYLADVERNKPNTVSHHMTILRAVLNFASEYPSHNYRLDSSIFKKLITSTTPAKKDLPTMIDIKKLMGLPPEAVHYFEVNIFLLGISLGGLRFSDLLFLKYGDFKSTHLRFISSKTKKPVSIPFNDQLFVIMSRLFGFPTQIIKLSISDFLSDLQKGKNQPAINYNAVKRSTELKNNVLTFIKNKERNGYIFENILDTDIFGNYDKMFSMSKAQHDTYGIRRTRYNETLTKICKVHGLSIKKMTSHFSRYVAVMILLENGMDIVKISKVLQHAKIQQTIDYVKNNYDEKYLSEMSNMIGGSF